MIASTSVRGGRRFPNLLLIVKVHGFDQCGHIVRIVVLVTPQAGVAVACSGALRACKVLDLRSTTMVEYTCPPKLHVKNKIQISFQTCLQTCALP